MSATATGLPWAGREIGRRLRTPPSAQTAVPILETSHRSRPDAMRLTFPLARPISVWALLQRPITRFEMMFKPLLGVVLAGVCLMPPTAIGAEAALPPRPSVTLVAFGDSITAATRQAPQARWPEILKHSLHERFPGCSFNVINAGVGGNTSREGLRRIEKDVLTHDPDFVLVEFGNDATPNPARHVSFEEFVDNLRQIQSRVAERSNGRLVMLTFPPMIDRWHAKYNDEFYKRNGGQDAYQEHYRKLTRQFAKDHGLALADIDKAVREEISRHDARAFILPDGVHLTDRANRLVAEVVLAALGEEVSNLLKSAPAKK